MRRKILLTLLFVVGISAASKKSDSSNIFDFSKIITVDNILDSIRSNRTDCQLIARLFLARIRLYNGRLGAVTVLNYRGALADARQLDSYRKRANGRLFGRLHCVPTLIKDNILVAGLPTTLGLWAFTNATARTDASVVWRLKSEGALILGKANLPPFAFGLKSPDEPSEIGGQCRNPYSIAGSRGASVYGSSCGNAAGQAAGLAVIGLATDTAGSITWPASVCGLVGVRPPPKILPSDGVFPLLKHAGDTIAPITSTISDTILLLEILSSGNRSSRAALSNFSPRRPNGSPFRIGVLKELVYGQSDKGYTNLTRIDGKLFEYELDPEIFNVTEQFFVHMRQKANSTVLNVTLNLDEFTDQIHRIHRAWTDVFACTPQWVDGFFKRYPFHVKKQKMPAEVRNMTEMLAADGIPGHYKKFFESFSAHRSHCKPSLRKLRKIRTAAKKFLQKRIFDSDDVDVLVFPRPHRFPSRTESAADLFLTLDPAGALGFPAVTLPIGFGYGNAKSTRHEHRRHSTGMPVGLYMMTRPRKFKTMLDIGRLYEKTRPIGPAESHLPPEFV